MGTSIRLKNRFGAGYGIAILTDDASKVPKVRKFVTEYFVGSSGNEDVVKKSSKKGNMLILLS